VALRRAPGPPSAEALKASPLARSVAALTGSGPGGAVLASEVLTAPGMAPSAPRAEPAVPRVTAPAVATGHRTEAPTVWRIMASG
jgi:hypothetical protein